MGDGWYHCRDCRRKFTVRVGTMYERSHVPLHKWLHATLLLTDSRRPDVTVDLIRYMLDVSYKTAWAMTRRIRDAMSEVRS
jgi:transposase-like protein